MAKTVNDLMTHDVQAVSPEMPALLAAERMVRNRIRHLVVTDVAGKVTGMLSDRDVLKHLSPWLSKFKKQTSFSLPRPQCTVRDIMVSHPIVATPDTALPAAAELLGEKKIGCLPVVDDEMRPVGMLSVVDLLLHMAADVVPEDNSAEQFQFYRAPAILEENGDLVLPMDGSEIAEGNDKPLFARLGYDSTSGRVAVDLFTDEKRAGALPVRVSDNQMVVPAKEFVEQQNIEYRGSFEVIDDNKSGYVVLSPPQSV